MVSQEMFPPSPSDWKYVATPTKKKQLKVLVDLMKRPDIDIIINGADAGREGELIFRLVYEHAKCNKPVKRLWVSSMEESALKQGFNNLRLSVIQKSIVLQKSRSMLLSLPGAALPPSAKGWQTKT